MKRKYIVISSFFVAAMLLGLFCYATAQYAGNVSGKAARESGQESLVSQEVSNANQRTTSETRCIIEVYNVDSEELVREERDMPAEFAGMTRQEVENYLAGYWNQADVDEEETENLIDIQLLSFSKEELVIRKTYEDPEPLTGFYLRLTKDGEVAIYARDGKTLYEKTGIWKDKIPVEEVRRLENGYVVETEKELYSILENFSS